MIDNRPDGTCENRADIAISRNSSTDRFGGRSLLRRSAMSLSVLEYIEEVESGGADTFGGGADTFLGRTDHLFFAHTSDSGQLEVSQGYNYHYLREKWDVCVSG